MLATLAAAAAIAVLASAPTMFTDVWPPGAFQKDTTVTVEFAGQNAIERTCHPLFGAPPKGMITRACHTGRRLVMPNPCTFPRDDEYARLLCHELGHANGWPASHGPGPAELAEGVRGASAAPVDQELR
jgi:hypothetical protein